MFDTFGVAALDFSALATSLEKATLPTLCALLLIALVWLFKDGRARETAAAQAAATALNTEREARLKELTASYEARLATAAQFVPLMTKMVDGVGVLERVTSAFMARGA